MVSLTRKPTPRLSGTLTQASASPRDSWARPPPSTRTWPTPGTARPSPPPGSMALAGGPRTQSPGRRRLRSWPRGSAHAQLLRPAGGTHCRTPVAKGLRAVLRAGCGGTRTAAVAEQFPEATKPVPSASAATALSPQQPGAPPPAFRCRSLGNRLPKRYFRVEPGHAAPQDQWGLDRRRAGSRGQERTLVGRSETWTKGGTGEGPLRSAVLRPVHLRRENYRSQRAPLPPRLARSPTPPGPNCHPGWARCTLGRVVLQGAGVGPAIPLAPAPGSQRPPSVVCRVHGKTRQLFIHLPANTFRCGLAGMRLTRPQVNAARLP